VLTISVALSVGVDHMGDRNWFNRFPVSWTPTHVAELQDSYRHDFGDATLDLTSLDFSGITTPTYVDVKVDFGDLRVLVPPRVDVYVDASVDVGSAEVFDRTWGGLDAGSQSIVDFGEDGQGGGELHITARTDVGHLEVTR
jgi:predicted membrane protein